MRGAPSIVMTARFFKKIGRKGAQARVDNSTKEQRQESLTASPPLGRVADGSLGSLEGVWRESFLDKVLVSLVILRLSDANAAKIANAANLLRWQCLGRSSWQP